MKIGIDAKWYFNGPVGPRSYVRNIINTLARIDTENEYIIYLDKNDNPDDVEYSAPNFVTKTIGPSQSWLRVMLKFAIVARRDNLDLLLTHNFCPLVCRAKRIVMIYDIIFETHPELFTFIERVFFKAMYPASHLADRVLTISDYCKDVLADKYHVRKDKITTTLLGCDTAFSKTDDSAKIDSVRNKYNLPERYVLYVGRLNVRKNLIRLIEAFSNIEDTGIKLVIVGASDWKTSNLAPTIEASHVRDRLMFLGYVPDEDLPVVYQLATVFVYVSLVEGFGLPPLEAMGAGTPVISSNTSSLPEVVGDAALTVDPLDVDDIRAAIDKLLGSSELREELAQKGIERAKTFSWDTAARQTIEVFKEVYADDAGRGPAQ